MSPSVHLAAERDRAQKHHYRTVLPGIVEQVVEPDPVSWQYWFVLTVGEDEWLGRKFLVDPEGNWRISSIIKPWMLLGRKSAIDVTTRGAVFSYAAASEDECQEVFERAALDSSSILHFPFPCLDSEGNECVLSTEDWSDSLALAAALDAHEAHFRQLAIQVLKDVALEEGARIYDPACSTGAFIAAIARALPWTQCLGSDLSPGMIKLACDRYGDPNLSFQVGNADAPCCVPDSCDVLFVRFLNAEVVLQADALGYFRTLRPLVRKGGRIIAFGHTPVLFVPALHASNLGLLAISNIASLPAEQGLFQFYVLKAVS